MKGGAHPQQPHSLPVDPERHPVWHEAIPAHICRPLQAGGELQQQQRALSNTDKTEELLQQQ